MKIEPRRKTFQVKGAIYIIISGSAVFNRRFSLTGMIDIISKAVTRVVDGPPTLESFKSDIYPILNVTTLAPLGSL
jgi:hypothetical protein